MTETTPKVITIPEKPEMTRTAVQRQLRVAAYCRVSTDDEEQLTSYEAQKTYYTDKIMTNPNWTLSGIFADEGISGTSARKRPEFIRMIRKCRQGKIDLVLVKSISRFARNTVDCLNYIRALKELGIAVIFEKENINTLDSDSEMLITMMGAFAQAESESMSANVRWGKRQAMREGRVSIQYKRLYAYEKGEDGNAKIIPQQAEVVRRIYNSFLAGESLRAICDALNEDHIPTPNNGEKWSHIIVKNILSNEKYCGDVLMQKSYISDCISKKVIRNQGQLPMYLIQDHHEGIVSRDTYNAAQAELARRGAGKAQSQKRAPATGRSKYSSKYALTERLVCGECGTLYRRCTWTHHGQHRIVWRCGSRIDYATRYCKASPTLDEKPLQDAILSAINSVMSKKSELVDQITDAARMELQPPGGERFSISEIDRRIGEQEEKFQALFAQVKGNEDIMRYAEEFKDINDTLASLKARRALLLEQLQKDSAASRRIEDAVGILNAGTSELTEWDDNMIRQLVDTVKVVSATRISVKLYGGIEVEREIILES